MVPRVNRGAGYGLELTDCMDLIKVWQTKQLLLKCRSLLIWYYPCLMISIKMFGVWSLVQIDVIFFFIKMIELAGESVRPSAVGESALGGKFVQIFHRDHSVPL